jgi:hypothetical protein
MSNKIAKLNHTAAVVLVIGTIILLIGQLIRLKATSLELKQSR